MATRTRLEHRSFYIVNAILVRGTREIAEALAARPDVARVEGNPLIHNNLPQPGPAVEAPQYSSVPRRLNRASITRTRRKSGPWDSLGRILSSAAPTRGVRWTHNALKPHYRGGTDKTPITTTTGTMLSMTASATHAATIRLSLATTTPMAATPPARRSATTAWATRSGWRQGQSGSLAA